jgi:MFS-type transporter involved in bile tolerance (Atg22 family)
MGVTGLWSGSARIGIASINLLFITGAAVLWFVNEKEGKNDLARMS